MSISTNNHAWGEPSPKQLNERLYKHRQFKTMGAIFAKYPLERLVHRLARRASGFSKHWHGRHNIRNANNIRPTVARRRRGQFAAMCAFRVKYGV